MLEIPVLYVREEECCGCEACKSVCPNIAISMIEDQEGFVYPTINAERCANCRLCLHVCPLKNDNDNNVASLRIE